MVAIFVGAGSGLARSSGTALGGAGILGSAVQGRGGEAVSVNAATGNLLISQQDEFLTGRGLDIDISRTYNSLAQAGDGDNGDQWQMSSMRRLANLTGTLNSTGSSIQRLAGDGSLVTYSYATRGGVAAYWTTDGGGAHDRLVKSGSNWVWTDGATGTTETYSEYPAGSGSWRIVAQADTDGNTLTFSYNAASGLLDKVTSANGEWVQYVWSGTNLTQLVTGYTDLATSTAKTLTRTRYAYDGQNRLVQVTVDLSPGDNSIADGKTYVTSYSYDGSSKRVASITQTDGSSLAITYDGSGRVATLTQSVAAGDNRVTTLAYGANYTSITGPDGQVTRLDYAGGNLVPSSILDWNSSPVYTLNEPAGAIDGEVAGLFTSTPDATWSGVSAGGVPVAAGDSLTFAISLQAVDGFATTQELGLHASASGWGSGNSTARIISGPGTLIQQVGGRWRVSGLSTTEATRIEITRTYTQAEYGSAYFYVDWPGGYRDGQQLLAAGGTLTKNGVPGADFRQLTKITAPPAYAGATAQLVQFGYDGDGNLASVTDAAGKVTSYSYDADGNMLTSSDANGNGVTRTYGAKNEMLSETLTGSDASGAAVSHTTRYVYDSETHLRYMISAQGRVTEYRYSGPGQLELTITYPEHDYPIGSGAVTEAAMNSWRDAISDRQSAQYLSHIYDARGNLIQQVDYGYATPAGGASTTEGYAHNYFTYDQSGRLLSRQTATQNIETFVYDGLGRLVASTDKAGASTTILFNDAALTTSVTTGSGFTTVSSYNKAGDLVATSRSGTYDPSGSTSYLYDKLGRVRVATDATGNKSYVIYDKAGRKVADVNHYGHVTEYFYTAAGRVGGSVSYTNALTAAQITALGDPDNMLEMAALRPAAHTYDIWGWSVYDDGGRLIESIAGDGSVARFAYDGSDRLVKTTHFYNKLSAAQLTALRAAVPSAVVVPASDARDTVSRSFYDRDGRLIGALDGEGYLSEIVYDKAGQKVEEIAYAAKTGSTYWDAGSFDQLRASAAPTSSSNRRARYVYDGQGLLRFAIDTAGYVTEYVYESDVKWGAVGLVRSTIVHATAIATSDFTYDNVKALVAANAGNAANRKSFAVYDAAGRLAYAIDAEGAVTGFAYDAMGHVIKTVAYAAKRATSTLPTEAVMNSWRDANIGNAANRITRAWYTAAGNLRFTVDAEGYVTRNDYDAEGRLTAIKRWPNKIATTDVTSIATVDVLTLSAGTAIIETRTYDAAGHLSTTTDGEGVITAYYYYANGSQYLTVFAYGTADEARVVRGFDGAGRVVSEYAAYGQPEQAVTAYSYDGLGNLTSVTDPRGKVTTFSYDERGLRLTATDAAGGVTTYQYNAFGEVTQTTDPRGAVTTSIYDNNGRVTRTTDALGIATDYSYTVFGELANVTRAGAVTAFLYDKLGRVTRATDAMTFYEDYGYNAFGNRTSVRNKLGGTTVYAYDRRGLLTSETRPIASSNSAGTQVSATVTNSYAYDVRGNRIQMIEAAGLAEARTTGYVYDKADRLVETIGQTFLGMTPHSYIRYDARGNVTSTIDPAGARTIYYYDDLGRVTVTIDAAGTYTRSSYDANGNVTAVRVYATAVTVPADGGAAAEAPAAPAGTYRETSFVYDNLNRLTSSSIAGVKSGSFNGSAWVADTSAITTSYVYDAAGNVVKAVDANGNIVWNYYDALGRKTVQIDAEGYRTDWTYNADGNVTRERRYWNRAAAPAGTTTLPTVTADSVRDRITDFTYDLNGNRLSEARLGVAIHNGSGGYSTTTATISYLYNGLGQVVRKTEATGDQVNYSYDTGGRLIVEARQGFTDQSGALVTPTVDYYYDGLGNLSRTRQRGSANAAERVTTYGYDGGMLHWMSDAEAQDDDAKNGLTTYYWYDIAGRQTHQYYARYDSAGTLSKTALGGSAAYEGILTSYDALGRAVQKWQATYDSTNGWLDYGPRAVTTYSAFGEVAGVAIGGVTQQQNQYDAAGRLVATNAGDGVWKLFGYDRNGNQTIAITSAGENLAGLTFAQAFAKIGQANVNATYTVYDARSMATSTIEEGRQLVGTSDSQALISSRSYNAFGETASETNAAGATTSYSYNRIGRMIRSEGPTVQIALENGTSLWVRPSQDHYYDASGRLVATRDANGDYAAGGTAANGTSKAANSGNLTRLTLVAGTGYDGSEALVTAETHADGGVKQTKYDIHGDARTLIDEIGRTTTQSFDAMGRVTQVGHAGGLIDYYGYDGIGQRIKHWNSFLGSGEVETTDYDTQGRVSKTRAFGGDITTIATTWDATIAASGMGITTGGWSQLTTMANGKTLTEKSDIFGRATYKNDLGSHVTSYAYDVAGRQVSSSMGGATATFAWYNTGLQASNSGPSGTATYTYDKTGNRLTEALVSGGATIKNQTATYDSLGRLRTWAEAGNTPSVTPAASTSNEYDANGNVRRTLSSYKYLDPNGAPMTGAPGRDHWFRYDSMNRVVVNQGVLSNGVITRGSTSTNYGIVSRGGQDITYDAAGQRTSVLVTNTYMDSKYGYSFSETKELYYYDNAGRLIETRQVDGIGATGAGVKRSSYSYDAMGRQTLQQDFGTNGTTVVFSQTSSYNAKSQISSQSVSTLKSDNKTYTTATTNNFGSGSSYMLGAIVTQSMTNYVSGSSTTYSSTTNTYSWYDGSVQSTISYKPNTSQSTTYTTTFYYDGFGRLSSTYIADAKPHWVNFTSDELGQIVRRDETGVSGQTGAPHEVWYRFAGRQLGYTGNNGSTDMGMSASIEDRQIPPPADQGTFRNKYVNGIFYTDFSPNYDPINSYYQGAVGGTYTVQQGDTLQSIAQNLWGDSSLWYKLAEANGSSGASLIEGQKLILPTGVMRNTHNASTFSPYDPAEAFGDLSPNTAPKPKKNKCGVFGQILVAAVAIGLSVWLGPQFIQAAQGVLAGASGAGVAAGAAGGVAAGSGIGVGLAGAGVVGGGLSAGAIAGAVVGGAAAAAVASAASQGFGIAIGAQSGFSWKGVGLAALGGGIGGALGGVNAFGGAAPGSFGGIANAAVRGIAGSVLTQGIGVATGLQSKFDFAGVAAAGIGAGAADFAGARTASWGSFGSDLATGMASALANAATRSAVSGNSFGDNLIAALPDAIGGALGRAGARGAAALARKLNQIATSTPAKRIEAAITEEQKQQIVGSGGVLINDSQGNLGVQGLSSSAVVAILNSEGAGAGRYVSGTDSIQRYGDGLGYIDTAPDEIMISQGVEDGGGIRFELLATDITITSQYFGMEGVGLTRALQGSRDGYDSAVWLYASQDTVTFGELAARVSFGEKLVVNAYKASLPTGNRGGQSISSYDPSVLDLVWQGGRERRDSAAAMWNNGGLGYIGGAVEWVSSPVTGALDVAQSYYRGRQGWVAPADRQTTDITLFAVGGARSAMSKLGKVGVAAEGSLPKFTFRGDSRLEAEIFRDGFAPRGNSTDLLAHALDNTHPPSAFVPTSRSYNVASGFADNVYVLRPVNGIDVNRTLGSASPFPLEQEIAIFGKIPPSNIRAVTRPAEGVSILNPGYKPR